MKKYFFLILFFLSSMALLAQDDCSSMLRTARSCKSQGQYKQAVAWYNKVLNTCGDYDGKVKTELQECQRKSKPQRSPEQYVPIEQPGLRLNDTQVFFEAEGGNDAHIHVTCDGHWVVNVTKGREWLDPGKNGDLLVVDCLPNTDPEPREGILYVIAGEGTIVAKVTVRQEEGDASFGSTSTTNESQLVSVKASFGAGMDVPSYENVLNLIAVLANNNNLGLKIEVPWCRNKYDIELIEKRSQNIMNYFLSMGLDKGRISQNISMNGDRDCDMAYLSTFPMDNNSISRTASPKGQENGSSDKKQLVTKDKVALNELVDVLSKTEITFDSNKDIPKIVDYNDNINRTVDVLKDHPSFGLQIEVYACGPGSEEHNRDLAQRRANNVMQLFIDKGVNPAQISTAKYTINGSKTNNLSTDKSDCDLAIFRLLVN